MDIIEFSVACGTRSISFKTRRNIAMHAVKKNFAEWLGTHPDSLTLQYNATFLTDNDTPNDIGMHNGDIVRAVRVQ